MCARARVCERGALCALAFVVAVHAAFHTVAPACGCVVSYLQQRLGQATMTAIYQLVEHSVDSQGVLTVDTSLEDILGNDAELLDLVYRLVAFDKFGSPGGK